MSFLSSARDLIMNYESHLGSCVSPPRGMTELRAPKRRRIVELTDSIISTAFSAAVIGTAVGLTAYRL